MMKRRDFLRATLITATAALVPACGSDPEIVNNPPGRTLEDGRAFFPQSVASGDPRPESVILWTRLEDPAHLADDLELELEVSTDAEFKSLVTLSAEKSKIAALTKYDHCAKVKLTGLDPATTYHYRFIYAKDGKYYVSRVGRTRTAPEPSADVAVTFAYVSCQDYIGRHYNAHIALAQEEIDFVVHLGDYIYETTGDPSFQNTTGRKVEFKDTAGAIALTSSGGETYHAASSLDNYRELYKTYRSDLNLQKVHEQFPMIVIWDDHEFSDDCHGATASYFDGEKDELDVDRRKRANQAFFEYQPIDYADKEDFAYDPSATYPDDIRIHRDFVFGKNLHLVMTDLRTFRADHLIPEEAFPGEVVIDEAALIDELGMVPDTAGAYVDIDAYQGGLYKQALTAAAPTVGYDPAKITGNISVAYINAIVGPIMDPNIPVIDDATQMTLAKGIAYIDLGKSGLYSSIGSRYFTVKENFDIYASWLYKKTTKASEDVLGAAQESWFLDTMKSSTATWKVWGNEYCLTQLAIDLRPYGLPAAFNRRFYMNVDAWDGFRNRRSDLIKELSAIGGVVAITGDVHAFYAATPMANDDPTIKLIEIVGSSVSSKCFKSMLESQVASDPVLSKVPGASLLATNIDMLLTSETAKTNPHLGYAASASNGYVVVRASASELAATMTLFGEKEVNVDYSGKEAELAQRIKRVKFRTLPGESELYKEVDGAYQKWDPTTLAWV